MTDIADLSAFDLVRAYRDGALSPVETTKALLAELDRCEPTVNALALRDDSTAMAMAVASERRWREGAPLGPLDGVPATIKDNIDVQGWPTRRGSALSTLTPAAADAPAAARLREAGAIFLGKTTMPEYGWKGTSDSPATGITRNPWNPALTAGGSSSGAAALAALRIGRVHVGTDAAGSVRIPAAFCGVAAFKSTFGRVPAYPVSSMGVLAHLGPICPSARETALAMNALGRPDTRDMMAVLADQTDYLEGVDAGVKGLRVAYSPRLGFDVEVDPDIAALTRKAAKTFETLGAKVEEIDPGFADPIQPLMVLWESGAAQVLAAVAPERRARMDQGFVALGVAGASIPAARYVQALLYDRNALALAMARFHERFDLLICPTMPTPAFEAGRLTPAHGRYGGDWTNWSPFTYPFNLTQQPAASVPSGLTREGAPASLQIIGPFGADRLVLRAACAFEAASEGIGRAPLA